MEPTHNAQPNPRLRGSLSKTPGQAKAIKSECRTTHCRRRDRADNGDTGRRQPSLIPHGHRQPRSHHCHRQELLGPRATHRGPGWRGKSGIDPSGPRFRSPLRRPVQHIRIPLDSAGDSRGFDHNGQADSTPSPHVSLGQPVASHQARNGS